jgi:hypothetical protein
MKIRFNYAAAMVCLAGFLSAIASAPALAEDPKPVKLNTTADHSKFKELQREFATGPEVTKACLSCHTEAAGQIHRTKHWKWEYVNPDTQQVLGKKHVINNYCISIATNEASCNSCHVGYGWKDASFDFKSEENVDCVVCHDTTGNYKKPSGLAGNVVTKDTEFPVGSGKIIKGIDLSKIAQKVGKSSRDTCGACHFNGGGGDGVKHGDLTALWPLLKKSWMSTWMLLVWISPAPPATRPPAMTWPAAATHQQQKTPRALTCAATRVMAIRPPACHATARHPIKTKSA